MGAKKTKTMFSLWRLGLPARCLWCLWSLWLRVAADSPSPPCSETERQRSLCVDVYLGHQVEPEGFRVSEGVDGASAFCARRRIPTASCKGLLDEVSRIQKTTWQEHYRGDSGLSPADVVAPTAALVELSIAVEDGRTLRLEQPLRLAKGERIGTAVDRLVTANSQQLLPRFQSQKLQELRRDLAAGAHSYVGRKMQGKRRLWLLLEQGDKTSKVLDVTLPVTLRPCCSYTSLQRLEGRDPTRSIPRPPPQWRRQVLRAMGQPEATIYINDYNPVTAGLWRLAFSTSWE